MDELFASQLQAERLQEAATAAAASALPFEISRGRPAATRCGRGPTGASARPLSETAAASARERTPECKVPLVQFIDPLDPRYAGQRAEAAILA